MRSLFLKIFLSFWLTQALSLVLAIFVGIALRPQREAVWESLQSRVLNESVQSYQSEGENGVKRYLGDLQNSQHVRAFLFDQEGKEVSGARPPEWVEHFEQGRPASPGFLRRFGPDRFLRQSTISANGRRYTLVMELPPSGPRVFFGPRGVPLLWILIAVVSSGIVCYVLAAYLTKPVVRLRKATQKLAAGDLSARAGAFKGNRGDEIAELVRDFDSMAGRLEAMVQAQSRLWNDISHELRSPLARLTVALELARQRSGPEAASALERIDLESNRLNELIGRLLTIAKIESGEESMTKPPIHLPELVDQIAEDAEFEAQSRNCHVKLKSADDLVVNGNESLLRSAIENVVRNAIRYTSEGTNVEILLTHEDVTAVLTVMDSGPGVPTDALDKMFRPFYRVDDARGRQTGGVGLGLAIAERSIRLHGGTVKAVNREGGGLMVEIRLPLANPVQVKTPVLA
jgi:two-component system sensor histidine kinase CpxA